LILTGAGVVISASCIIGTGLVAAGRTRIVLAQVLLATAVNLSANALLIPSFGTTGAAVSTVLTELVSLVFLAVACERAIPGAVLGRRRTTATAFGEASTA
jgi:O-antigen/teichoic acid export membrane protein